MSIKTPYLRKKTWTLLAFTAIVLLLSSPLVISNFLLQPAQAQTTVTFKTPTPSTGTHEDPNFGNITLQLTFQGQATTSPDGSLNNLTGDFEIDAGEREIFKGTMERGFYRDRSFSLVLESEDRGEEYHLDTSCRDSARSTFTGREGEDTEFRGPVECSTSSSSSSPTTGTTTTTTTKDSDSDSDGIPDSSDKCPHNSNHRCFKEGGGTSSGTTNEQEQPSSSSSSSGNQTG